MRWPDSDCHGDVLCRDVGAGASVRTARKSELQCKTVFLLGGINICMLVNCFATVCVALHLCASTEERVIVTPRDILLAVMATSARP